MGLRTILNSAWAVIVPDGLGSEYVVVYQQKVDALAYVERERRSGRSEITMPRVARVTGIYGKPTASNPKIEGVE